MFQSFLARAVWPTCLMIGAASMTPEAQAAGGCSGSMQTSLLHALPKPMIVMGTSSIGDTANPQLTRRFVDGLQKAGVTVADQGNVTLSIAVSVTAPGTGSNVVSGQYKGFDWMSGEPVAPAQTIPGIRSTHLSLSAVLADNVAVTQSWVATIECQVQTDDPNALAEDIGTIIGRAIGTNLERRPI